MRNFKKVLLSALAVLLCFALFVGIAVYPYFTEEAYYYQDSRVRKELAGTLDLLVSGASHGFRAIMPQVLDEQLGCTSYNLGCSMETMEGRYELLAHELGRNPVSTVILELSYNSLTRTYAGSGFEGNVYHLGRMDDPGEWLSYFFTAVPPRDYVKTLYDLVDRGVDTWARKSRGELPQIVQYETHGFVPCTVSTPQIAADTYRDIYHSESLSLDIWEENRTYLEKTLALCGEKGIQVILVVTPISEGRLWRYSGYDTILQWYRDISEKWGCPLYDFNRYRDKLEHYPEDTGFYDTCHLTEDSAAVFSMDLAEILEMRRQGIPTEDLFYGSYEEAIHARLEALE